MRKNGDQTNHSNETTLPFLTALLLAPLVFTHAGVTLARRNITVIVADDLGYSDVLFNTHHPKEVTTPNLDSLAKESVIFGSVTSRAWFVHPRAPA